MGENFSKHPITYIYNQLEDLGNLIFFDLNSRFCKIFILEIIKHHQVTSTSVSILDIVFQLSLLKVS